MKIAIIDSGVFDAHPHLGPVAGALHFTATGMGDDPVDRLGHGTAIASAIREKAPEAQLYSLKVFDRRLACSMSVILRALEWCRDQRMDVVSLSLGTSNPEHADLFREVLDSDSIVISAANMLPGTLPGVIAVDADPECPRDRFYEREGVYYASPFPRPIDGLPPARNLQGVSFSVANVTGLIARKLQLTGASA
jgi:hypothetical protein